MLPCEGFFLQNEVGLRDAIAFLHFCQLHVAPELVARGHRSRNKAAEEETESQMTLSKSSSKVYIDIKPLEGTASLPTEPADLAAQLSSTGWDLLFGTNRLQKWVSVTGAISRVVRQTVARA